MSYLQLKSQTIKSSFSPTVSQQGLHSVAQNRNLFVGLYLTDAGSQYHPSIILQAVVMQQLRQSCDARHASRARNCCLKCSAVAIIQRASPACSASFRPSQQVTLTKAQSLRSSRSAGAFARSGSGQSKQQVCDMLILRTFPTRATRLSSLGVVHSSVRGASKRLAS